MGKWKKEKRLVDTPKRVFIYIDMDQYTWLENFRHRYTLRSFSAAVREAIELAKAVDGQ